jgi:hypothetical protein
MCIKSDLKALVVEGDDKATGQNYKDYWEKTNTGVRGVIRDYYRLFNVAAYIEKYRKHEMAFELKYDIFIP